MKFVFEFEEPLGFLLLEAGEGDAGHFADNLGDHFLITLRRSG